MFVNRVIHVQFSTFNYDEEIYRITGIIIYWLHTASSRSKIIKVSA